MKKSFKILILSIFTGLNIFNSANCATLSNAQLNKIIYSKVYSEISTSLKNYSNDFKINITGIPNESYSTNDNFTPKVEIVSQNTKFQPRLFKRVLIKDSKNNTLKAFPINVQTLVYKNVLIAKENISYGKEIKQSDVTLSRKEVSNYLDKAIFEYKEGMTSSRNFQKGAIIVSNGIKEKSAVSKNSIVEIIFISKSIRITLHGKALKDGAIGDKIPVRSDKYNKIYTGLVNSENEVIVRI